MIALFSGRGALPLHLARRLAAEGRGFVVCVLDGQPPDADLPGPRLSYRLEALLDLLTTLHERGVTEVCFAGAVTRPRIDPARVTPKGEALLSRIAAALAAGDDGTLRAFMTIFEEAGFAMLAAQDICPELLLPAGCATIARPPEGVAGMLVAARATIARLGAADAGQACLVGPGGVLAEEGPLGTDAMIRAAGDAARGAVLYKSAKPTQDRRADMPTIGPETAEQAARACLAGIAVEAGGVLVLDQPRVIERLDAAGLFLLVAEPEGAA